MTLEVYISMCGICSFPVAKQLDFPLYLSLKLNLEEDRTMSELFFFSYG